MDHRDLLRSLKGITPEEFNYATQIMNGMSDEQARQFVMFYSGKRRPPSDILLFTLIAFLGIAGVERFVIGQIGMGLLYLFTGGLCLIGTIVDIINHKSLALEHNQRVAIESAQMVRGM